MSIASAPIANFQGSSGVRATLLGEDPGSADPGSAKTPRSDLGSDLDSREIEIKYARDKFARTGDPKDAAVVAEMAREEASLASRFQAVWRAVAAVDLSPTRDHPAVVDMECHYAAHRAYVSSCGGWTTAALKYSAVLAKLCEVTGGDAAPIRSAIRAQCV